MRSYLVGTKRHGPRTRRRSPETHTYTHMSLLVCVYTNDNMQRKTTHIRTYIHTHTPNSSNSCTCTHRTRMSMKEHACSHSGMHRRTVTARGREGEKGHKRWIHKISRTCLALLSFNHTVTSGLHNQPLLRGQDLGTFHCHPLCQQARDRAHQRTKTQARTGSQPFYKPQGQVRVSLTMIVKEQLAGSQSNVDLSQQTFPPARSSAKCSLYAHNHESVHQTTGTTRCDSTESGSTGSERPHVGAECVPQSPPNSHTTFE